VAAIVAVAATPTNPNRAGLERPFMTVPPSTVVTAIALDRYQ
jgi:hypothetical protein